VRGRSQKGPWEKKGKMAFSFICWATRREWKKDGGLEFVTGGLPRNGAGGGLGGRGP